MRRFVVMLGLMAVFAPSLSQAYVASPRYGAFELKFGPHRLNGDTIITEDGLTYTDYFGGDSMVNTTLELDWQFARINEVASFGVGGSWGFMRDSGKARLSGENQQTDADGNPIETSDKTAINVMPFALLGIIRLDVLADKVNIPLVPFFKIGLNWYLWWVRTAEETTDHGGTPGWQLNLGLAIRLDGFDRMSARTFDNEVGVNHSYLFFEYMYARVEGLWADDKLPMSPTNIRGHGTWWGGLCLEF